jgi:hypothetical protein
MGVLGMGERVADRTVEAYALEERDDDRASAVVALAVSSLSGFVVGLLIRGSIAQGALTAVAMAAAGAAGWWMRGVLR